MTNKTPEQMAEEYCEDHDECEHARIAFLAGYKAAKEEEATKDQKIAELWTESIRRMLPSVHEITLFPSKPSNDEVVAKMDAAIEKAKGNSSNNSNGWISVKERLPAPQEEVLWWNKAAQQAGVSSYEYMPHCNDTMIYWGDAGNLSIKNFTHWMPLPEAPKEEG